MPGGLHGAEKRAGKVTAEKSREDLYRSSGMPGLPEAPGQSQVWFLLLPEHLGSIRVWFPLHLGHWGK